MPKPISKIFEIKNRYFKLMILVLIVFFSCNSQKKSDEVASYSYTEEVVEMSDKLRSKIPEWVVEGKICYGLVVQLNEKKKEIKGKPIRAKVVQIGKDAVKMKALETVSLAEIEGCTKMGISKGETWDEDEGDFYLTKQDAIAVLKKKNLYKFSDKVTVD